MEYQDYTEYGLCALPADVASKRPLVSWKQYQDRTPTLEELAIMPSGDGICFLTGRASGGLEVIDFDQGGRVFGRWLKEIKSIDPTLAEVLVIQRTQSGGYHVAYRVWEDAIEGNQKLARSADGATLIETRGQGGLVIAYPSPGYKMVQGSWKSLTTLSGRSREILLTAAMALDETVPEVVDKSVKQSVNVGSRPGDMYDHQVTEQQMFDLLRKHGWTYLSRSQDSTFWKRPNKTAKGHSASLGFVDGKWLFYVFSSNVPEFGHQKAHTPFQVYAILEHGGDFEAAASALARQGFGELVAVDVQDPVPVFSGEFPTELLRVPGFVGEFAEWVLAGSHKRQPVLALAAALSVQGTLLGRVWQDQYGTVANLYHVCLVPSGGGKERPRGCVKELLYRLEREEEIKFLGPEGWQSGQSIYDMLVKHPNLLCVVDEFGRYMESVTESHNQNVRGVVTELMKCYSSSNSAWMSSAYATGDKGDRVVDRPNLTVLASSTEEAFGRGLTESELCDGFYSRCLLWMGDSDPEHLLPEPVPLPDKLLQIAATLSRMHPVGLESCYCRTMPVTREAHERYVQYAREATESHRRMRGSYRAGVIWTRALEKARKLGMLYAISRDPGNPVVDLESTNWSIRLANYLTLSGIYFAEDYISEGPYELKLKKVLRTVRSRGPLTYGQLMRLTRDYRVQDRNGFLDDLLATGDIEKRTLLGKVFFSCLTPEST